MNALKPIVSDEFKRKDCNILSLVLKGEWYARIASGQKKCEYRMATPYWRTRIGKFRERADKNWGALIVEFRHGYAKNAPRMAFTIKGIGYGLPPCGSKRDTENGEPAEGGYFAIYLGHPVRLEGGAE